MCRKVILITSGNRARMVLRLSRRHRRHQLDQASVVLLAPPVRGETVTFRDRRHPVRPHVTTREREDRRA